MIEIEQGLTLNNPTATSQGIKDAVEIDPVTLEEGEVLYRYLEIYFKEEGS